MLYGNRVNRRNMNIILYSWVWCGVDTLVVVVVASTVLEVTACVVVGGGEQGCTLDVSTQRWQDTIDLSHCDITARGNKGPAYRVVCCFCQSHISGQKWCAAISSYCWHVVSVSVNTGKVCRVIATWTVTDCLRMVTDTEVVAYGWLQIQRWLLTDGYRYRGGCLRMVTDTEVVAYGWLQIQRWLLTDGYRYRGGCLRMVTDVAISSYCWHVVSVSVNTGKVCGVITTWTVTDCLWMVTDTEVVAYGWPQIEVIAYGWLQIQRSLLMDGYRYRGRCGCVYEHIEAGQDNSVKRYFFMDTDKRRQCPTLK